MINGIGVIGFGVGGIEAEAVMLGQPLSLPMPIVVGLQADRRAPGGRDGHRPGADRHRAAAQARRGRQVRRGLRRRPLLAVARRPRHDRQHVARVRRHRRLFPVDAETLRLHDGHRPLRPRSSPCTEAYTKVAGTVPHRRDAGPALRRDTLELDLATIVPSLAGPRRPQDRVTLAPTSATPFRAGLPDGLIGTTASRRTTRP